MGLLEPLAENPLLLFSSIALGLIGVVYLVRKASQKSARQKSSSSSKEVEEEFEVARVSDFKPNEMRELDVNGGKILLVRNAQGKFYATGHKCTHYGAQLVKGVLSGDRVTCPWHAACFNITTGDIEDAPAINAIPSFPTFVRGDSVYVRLPTPLPEFKRVPTMCSFAPLQDKRVFVVVGGGSAGAVAAEALRQEGFQGTIVVVSEERFLPYDRIKLSKSLSVKMDSILLRTAEFYEKHGIKVQLNTRVTAIDVDGKTLTLNNTTQLRYDGVVLATGGVARRLRCEGSELANIFTLRVPDDTENIEKALSATGGRGGDKHVVIIGSSFIGMEMASILVNRLGSGKGIASIVVVGMEKVPFERVLGEELGCVMMDMHAQKGIQFRMERVLQRYIPAAHNAGVVGAVQLNDGEVLPADVVVVGAGIVPATDFLKGKLALFRDGGVLVDDHMRARRESGEVLPDVYAVGDIARFPYWGTGEEIRVEHWDVAQDQARVAAKNLAGNGPARYDRVPFFWTTQYGVSLRYAGNAMTWDSVLIRGSKGDAQNPPKFAAYFVKNNRVTACVTMGVDPVAAAVSALLRSKKMPSPDELARNDVNYVLSLLH